MTIYSNDIMHVFRESTFKCILKFQAPFWPPIAFYDMLFIPELVIGSSRMLKSAKMFYSAFLTFLVKGRFFFNGKGSFFLKNGNGSFFLKNGKGSFFLKFCF